jgi:hypothetical protein
LDPPPPFETQQVVEFYDGDEAPRAAISERLLGPIRRVRSIPDGIKRFVREAPLAAATTVLVAAAIAVLLVIASANGRGARPIESSQRHVSPGVTRLVALGAVPIATVPRHRHHRHRHRRHLRFPAITVPESLEAPGASPSVP